MRFSKFLVVVMISSFAFTSCMSDNAQEAEPSTDKTETPKDATKTDDTNPADLDENVTPKARMEHQGSDEDAISDTMPGQ